jgi:uncharacterized protein (TIGR04222 family)
VNETWGISGPAFIALYLVTIGVVLVLATIHRRLIFRGQPTSGYDHVGPQQAAYLNGGAQLAVYSSLGALRRAGAIGVHPDRTLAPTGPMPAGVTPLDQAVYNAAGKRILARTLSADPWVATALTQLREGLERSGLALTPGRRQAARLWSTVMAAVVGLGVLRLIAGMRNDRPVGFLFFAIVLAFLCTIVLLRVPFRTKAGTAALGALRAQHSYLAPKQSPAYATYGAAAAGMGVALFGAASLYALDPGFAAEAEIQRNMASGGSGYSGDGGSSSSCSGGSSCGGGGGGGGGCGGGGCGG